MISPSIVPTPLEYLSLPRISEPSFRHPFPPLCPIKVLYGVDGVTYVPVTFLEALNGKDRVVPDPEGKPAPAGAQGKTYATLQIVRASWGSKTAKVDVKQQVMSSLIDAEGKLSITRSTSLGSLLGDPAVRAIPHHPHHDLPGSTNCLPPHHHRLCGYALRIPPRKSFSSVIPPCSTSATPPLPAVWTPTASPQTGDAPPSKNDSGAL